MRHRVRIEQISGAQNDTGEEVMDWSLVGTYWAAVIPVDGRELSAGDQTNAEVTTVMVMRRNPVIEAKMRAIYLDDIYNITQPPMDVDGMHKWMILLCSTGLNDG